LEETKGKKKGVPPANSKNLSKGTNKSLVIPKKERGIQDENEGPPMVGGGVDLPHLHSPGGGSSPDTRVEVFP